MRKPVSSAFIMVLGLLLVIIIMAAGGLVSRWDVKSGPSLTEPPRSAYWQVEGAPSSKDRWQSSTGELSLEKREGLRSDIIAIRKNLSRRVSEEKVVAP